MTRTEQERLVKIFRRLLSPFPGEARNALSLFQQEVGKQDIHPNDLEVILVNSRRPDADEYGSLVAQLRDDLFELQVQVDTLTENSVLMEDYIRQHGGDPALKALARETRKSTWLEFYDLVATRLFKGKLPANWMALVADRFETTTAKVRQWELGRAQVPREIIRELQALPAPESNIVIQPAAERISPEVFREIADATFRGVSPADIMALLGVTEAQVRMLWGRRPPPELGIKIPLEGPLDWWQLWEMASNVVSQRGWKVAGLARLGVADPDRVSYRVDLNALVDPVKLAEMRQEYQKTSRWAIFVRGTQEYVAREKPSGLISWSDVQNAVRSHRGMSNSETTAFTTRYNEEFGTTFRKQGMGRNRKPSAAKATQRAGWQSLPQSAASEAGCDGTIEDGSRLTEA